MLARHAERTRRPEDEEKRETDLNANLVQAAIKQTVENIDALKTDWEKGRRISKPEYDPTEGGWAMLFDKRSSVGSAAFQNPVR